MKTVLEVIQATTAYLTKRGTESPRLSIEHLLAHVLGKRRMDLYMEFDRPLSDRELEPLRDLVRRRALGEPLQHLLGTVEFLGRTFRSDKRALIPRPETEQLCEILVGRFKGMPPPERVLDVGTGSGVIALTLAAEWPGSKVEAVDLSEDALALAEINAGLLGLQDRVILRQGNLLEGASGVYDLIAANLPYIPTEGLAGLATEVQHDPRSALDGGLTGLDQIIPLIAGGGSVLKGMLALEIGHDQSTPVVEVLTEYKYQDIQVTTDYQGRNRFVFAQYG